MILELNLDLIALGIITGFSSGFFGIGGGSILIPLLLLSGYLMKEAVAISIMQMLFSSVYGSFLNSKKTKGLLRDGVILGLGGSVGGIVSGYFLPDIPNIYLQYLFITSLLYTIYTLFRAPATQDVEHPEKSILILLMIGFFVGMLAMSIGIGGSILLLPVLVKFLKYDFKTATALGLFFVIFSSTGGFISTSIYGNMLYTQGAIVGVGSLLGVYFGIKVKNRTKATSYKTFILILNVVVLAIMVFKTF